MRSPGYMTYVEVYMYTCAEELECGDGGIAMSTATVQPTRNEMPAARRLGVSGLWAVPSVRWAVAALCLFLVGLTAQLLGAPFAIWWTLYGACYFTGGWSP